MPTLPASAASERLSMRMWTADDATALGEAITASVEHLIPWMPWAAAEPLARQDRVNLIAGWETEWRAGGDVVYGIFLDGRPIGGTGLHRRLGDGGLEIGYWIHVDYTRRGYATEVSEALTDLAFSLAEIDRVEIHHDKANEASGAVPRRLGYVLVAEQQREITAPGEVGITSVWRITREQWTARTDLSRTS